MIELRNVKKEFNKYKVFENVNMSFPKNGLFAILGKSGSGKSTILNIISGYLEPDAGEVLFNGNNISGFNDKEKEIYRKEIISFIFLSSIIQIVAFAILSAGTRR